MPDNYKIADVFTKLRNQILQIPLEKIPADQNVYGVLLEMGYPSAIVTLVSLIDGGASLYFSNGGGILGAGKQAPVNAAAKKLVAQAEPFIQQFQKADSCPLPQKGSGRFHILSRQGIFTIEAPLKELEKESAPLFSLYYQAQAVITQIRLLEEKRKKEPPK